MSQSATELRIEKAAIWSALAVYWTAWTVGIGTWLDGAWLVGIFTASAYVSMHAYEIAKRKHCYLSADSTAVPISAAIYIASIAMLQLTGYMHLPKFGYIVAFACYAGVLFVGHLAALAYTAGLNLLLSL